jgi:hypothetical protein
MKYEPLTVDEQIEVSRLLSEYLSVIEHFPLVQDEYWKRRNLIHKYQRSISLLMEE